MNKGVAGFPGQCCLNCVFLAQVVRSETPTEPEPGHLEWKKQVKPMNPVFRQKLARGERIGMVTFRCDQAVWGDRRGDTVPEGKPLELLTKDRGELCFFYEYSPDMTLTAANELEKRATDRREAKRDRNVVKWGIIVGLAGAVLGAALVALATLLR